MMIAWIDRVNWRRLCSFAIRRLVGWVHVATFEFVESGAFAVIGGFVVEGNSRRKGVTRGLTTAAEEWAEQRGCSSCAYGRASPEARRMKSTSASATETSRHSTRS